MKISENVKKLFIVLGTVIGIILVLRFGGAYAIRIFAYAFRLLSPFVFGYLFSIIINPLADTLQKKLKVPRGVSVVSVIILTLAAAIGIIGGVGYKIYTEILKFCQNIPEITAEFKSGWTNISSQLNVVYVKMPTSVQLMLDKLGTNITGQASKFLSDVDVVGNAQNIAKALPGAIIWTVIFILALYFMVNHKKETDEFVKKILGEKNILKVDDIRREFKLYLGGYLKAQIILMVVIFIIISVALSIFGAPYAIIVAASTAFLDALPIFGSGITLWPLSIMYFANGNIKLGAVYIITYLVIMLVRRILEPKLVSEKMGLNPILTLASMYAGYCWWNIKGLIFGPIVLMIVVSLYKVGLFDRILRALKQLFSFLYNEIKLFTKYVSSITKGE